MSAHVVLRHVISILSASQLHFLANKNTGWSKPVNCINVGRQFAVLSGPTVYSLYCVIIIYQIQYWNTPVKFPVGFGLDNKLPYYPMCLRALFSTVTGFSTARRLADYKLNFIGQFYRNREVPGKKLFLKKALPAAGYRILLFQNFLRDHTPEPARMPTSNWRLGVRWQSLLPRQMSGILLEAIIWHLEAFWLN